MRMITVGATNNAAINKDLNRDTGLDNLVISLCETYRIPASMLVDLQSGLTTALYEYLSRFISDNNLSLAESINSEFKIKDPQNRSEEISAILESARVNGTIRVTYNDSSLIELINESEQITYQLGQAVAIDKLDGDALLEAWKCSDILHVRPLLESIFDQLRKE